MDDIPIGLLFAALAVLILFSAFFSGSETAMMALNRYRLKHLCEQNHKGAIRANSLLEKPDRLIGLILLGNNFVNILASSIATIIAIRLYGEVGIPIAAAVLTLIVLIFAEVTPKTMAALKPESVAFPVSIILKPLLVILYPFVWTVNLLANNVLKLLHISPNTDNGEMSLSREELRTVVQEAGTMIPKRHQQMLFGILDLEKVTVEDIMIPRNEVAGIDLDTDVSELEEQLRNCRHTRIPVYFGNLNQIVGIMHIRKIPDLLGESDTLSANAIQEVASDPYFVPIGTQLHTQLRNFQRQKRRLGFVVDEYGDFEGLVTLEDILEEIVGEFTTDPGYNQDIHEHDDGSFLIDASANIRDINKSLKWDLSLDGPKTLNGLIIETLENIPATGTSLRVDNYTIEILQTSKQSVKTVKMKQLEMDPDE
ncbi:MAG: HlyC/CorC family transporter [Gammaproteobacteria bacterium]